jgi:hypothetical protein
VAVTERPQTGATVQKQIHLRPEQDAWVANEAHRRTMELREQGKQGRVSQAEIVREAIDAQMETTG